MENFSKQEMDDVWNIDIEDRCFESQLAENLNRQQETKLYNVSLYIKT